MLHSLPSMFLIIHDPEENLIQPFHHTNNCFEFLLLNNREHRTDLLSTTLLLHLNISFLLTHHVFQAGEKSLRPAKISTSFILQLNLSLSNFNHILLYFHNYDELISCPIKLMQMFKC